jgi:hypothetical protein
MSIIYILFSKNMFVKWTETKNSVTMKTVKNTFVTFVKFLWREVYVYIVCNP